MEKQPAQLAATATLHIDLMELCRDSRGSGPQWGCESEDLNLTLLSWEAGKVITTHVNDEVDVVVIVLDGEGEITVNGQVYAQRAGQALLIPKGTERSIRSLGNGFHYLSLHRRRRGVVLTTGGRPAPRLDDNRDTSGKP